VELLVFLIVVAVAIFWLKGRAGRAAPPPVQNYSATMSMTSFGYQTPVDVGSLRETVDGAWVLNPESPLPLTLLGANRSTAEKVRSLLLAEKPWNDWHAPELSLLIAEHNLRFAQLDAYVADLKARADAHVAAAIARSAEWPTAGEKDRADLRRTFEVAAIESLGTPIDQRTLEALFRGPPQDLRTDDALVRLFDGKVALYAFVLQMLRHTGEAAVTVPADAYGRKDWEALIAIGVARRGQDIPVDAILAGFRLKDLNELLAGTRPKPYGRIAAAIEAAKALPDLKERLAKQVAYRELFQLSIPPGVDVPTVLRSFEHAAAVARVIQQTFDAGVNTLRVVAEAKADPGIYEGWRIASDEDPPLPCARTVCKATKRLPAKRPPFHAGCTCELTPE